MSKTNLFSHDTKAKIAQMPQHLDKLDFKKIRVLIEGMDLVDRLKFCDARLEDVKDISKEFQDKRLEHAILVLKRLKEMRKRNFQPRISDTLPCSLPKS